MVDFLMGGRVVIRFGAGNTIDRPEGDEPTPPWFLQGSFLDFYFIFSCFRATAAGFG
jgi:hypothetical protein